MRTIHPELHRTERIGWLRAAVLGANDGIVGRQSRGGARRAGRDIRTPRSHPGARRRGGPALVGTLRVVFWGALAMALTAAIGKVFGVVGA